VKFGNSSVPLASEMGIVPLITYLFLAIAA